MPLITRIGVIVLLGLLVVPGYATDQKKSDPVGGGADTAELGLWSKGIRQLLFIDLYTCEFYLPRHTTDIEDLMSSDTAIRIQVRVHGDAPESMPDDWAVLLRAELSDRIYKNLLEEYREIEKGDELAITYAPGGDTVVLLNNEKVITDPGKSLMEALLEQWIGPDPVSDDLKASLIAGPT